MTAQVTSDLRLMCAQERTLLVNAMQGFGSCQGNGPCQAHIFCCMKFTEGVSKDLGKGVKVPKGLREPKHKTWTSTQLAAPQMRKAVKECWHQCSEFGNNSL